MACAAFFNAPGVNAAQHNIVYPNGDSQTVIENWDGGVNSVVITYNNTDMTIGAVMLNPAGKPSNANAFGYSYIWVDILLNHWQWFGSNDGTTWQFIQTTE
jgi:hypothetical protein